MCSTTTDPNAHLNPPVVRPTGTCPGTTGRHGGYEMVWLVNRLMAEALVRGSATVERFRIEIRNGAELAATRR